MITKEQKKEYDKNRYILNKKKLLAQSKAYWQKHGKEIDKKRNSTEERKKILAKSRHKNKRKYKLKRKEYDKLHPVGPEYYLKYKSNPQNLLKLKARDEVVKMARSGKIVKINCSKCGSKDNLEFHHVDYVKNIVIVLCRKCHKFEHSKYKEEILCVNG